MAHDEDADSEQVVKSHVWTLPPSTRRDTAQVNSWLGFQASKWLKKHGKAVRPKLTFEQRQQLKECFELMDQDGSGAIDADELGAAFKLLGIRMKMAELSELLAEVDHDGSGEVEYLEFLEIMTTTLQRLAEKREAEEAAGSGAVAGDPQVPFALMATAYRRKRLMEGIITGDKEVMQQIMQLSERQAQEATAAKQEAEAEAARKRSGQSNIADVKRMLNSITKQSVAKMQALRITEALLIQLPAEERQLLTVVASKIKAPHDLRVRPDELQQILDQAVEEAAKNAISQGLPQAGAKRSGGASHNGIQGSSKSLPPSIPIKLSKRTQSPGKSQSSSPSPSSPSYQPQGYPTSLATSLSSSADAHVQAGALTATQAQLLQMPQILNLKFSKPTIKIAGDRGALAGALPLPSVARG